MEENHQNGANNNLATTENKLWLPPSFINGKAQATKEQPPTKKNTNSKWGFSGKTGWDWLNLLGVLAIPFVIAAGTLFFTQQITFQQAQASER
jgi:hypothetical protein